jgi:hypothetical protein
VNASNNAWRGAWKVRLISSSRSPGVANEPFPYGVHRSYL